MEERENFSLRGWRLVGSLLSSILDVRCGLRCFALLCFASMYYTVLYYTLI